MTEKPFSKTDENKEPNSVRVRSTVWENGNPVPVVVEVYTTESSMEVGRQVSSEIYLGSEPGYQGLKNLEVMWRKAIKRAAEDGDFMAIESMFNRLMGKPTQHTTAITATGKYSEFLEVFKSPEEQLKK